MASGQPIPDTLVTNFHSATWIWTPETDVLNPPVGERAFRKTYTPPTGKTPASALVLLTVDNSFAFYINGELVGTPPNIVDVWQKAQIYNVALNPGANLFALRAINLRGTDPTNNFGAAGVLASIQITFTDGTTTFFSSDASWRSIRVVSADFASPAIDDSAWSTSVAISTYGKGVWADDVSLPAGNIPALRTLPNSQTNTSVSSTPSSSPAIKASNTSSISSTSTVSRSPSSSTPTATPSISAVPSKVNAAAIGGGIGAAIVAAILLLALLAFLRRRRRRRNLPRTEKGPILDHPRSGPGAGATAATMPYGRPERSQTNISSTTRLTTGTYRTGARGMDTEDPSPLPSPSASNFPNPYQDHYSTPHPDPYSSFPYSNAHPDPNASLYTNPQADHSSLYTNPNADPHASAYTNSQPAAPYLYQQSEPQSHHPSPPQPQSLYGDTQSIHGGSQSQHGGSQSHYGGGQPQYGGSQLQYGVASTSSTPERAAGMISDTKGAFPPAARAPLVHLDGGRYVQPDPAAREEIPPTYDSVPHS